MTDIMKQYNQLQRAHEAQAEENADLALLADQYKAERDALAAKLDELQRQEPVGTVSETWAHWPAKGDVTTVDWVNDTPPPVGTELYTAPKALEPEPLIKFRHGCKWCGKAKCAAGCYGITKGTP